MRLLLCSSVSKQADGFQLFRRVKKVLAHQVFKDLEESLEKRYTKMSKNKGMIDKLQVSSSLTLTLNLVCVPFSFCCADRECGTILLSEPHCKI